MNIDWAIMNLEDLILTQIQEFSGILEVLYAIYFKTASFVFHLILKLS